MSEPKRFNFSATIVHHIDGKTTAALKYHKEHDGLFVSYEDYARLKAEVERLTKAGDWVMSHWSSGDGSDEVRFCQALLKWKNAKEGKQS
jgi:hypothetical protein